MQRRRQSHRAYPDAHRQGEENVVGTRVSARAELGYSSFTMEDGYQVELEPIGTPGAVASRAFTIARSGNDVYTGYFTDVFTDRDTPAEDRSQFWVQRGGLFWIRLLTWGTDWIPLQAPVCYLGPQGQVVVNAHYDAPAGPSFWTFVMQRV